MELNHDICVNTKIIVPAKHCNMFSVNLMKFCSQLPEVWTLTAHSRPQVGIILTASWTQNSAVLPLLNFHNKDAGITVKIKKRYKNKVFNDL